MERDVAILRHDPGVTLIVDIPARQADILAGPHQGPGLIDNIALSSQRQILRRDNLVIVIDIALSGFQYDIARVLDGIAHTQGTGLIGQRTIGYGGLAFGIDFKAISIGDRETGIRTCADMAGIAIITNVGNDIIYSRNFAGIIQRTCIEPSIAGADAAALGIVKLSCFDAQLLLDQYFACIAHLIPHIEGGGVGLKFGAEQVIERACAHGQTGIGADGAAIPKLFGYLQRGALVADDRSLGLVAQVLGLDNQGLAFDAAFIVHIAFHCGVQRTCASQYGRGALIVQMLRLQREIDALQLAQIFHRPTGLNIACATNGDRTRVMQIMGRQGQLLDRNPPLAINIRIACSAQANLTETNEFAAKMNRVGRGLHVTADADLHLTRAAQGVFHLNADATASNSKLALIVELPPAYGKPITQNPTGGNNIGAPLLTCVGSEAAQRETAPCVQHTLVVDGRIRTDKQSPFIRQDGPGIRELARRQQLDILIRQHRKGVIDVLPAQRQFILCPQNPLVLDQTGGLDLKTVRAQQHAPVVVKAARFQLNITLVRTDPRVGADLRPRQRLARQAIPYNRDPILQRNRRIIDGLAVDTYRTQRTSHRYTTAHVDGGRLLFRALHVNQGVVNVHI